MDNKKLQIDLLGMKLESPFIVGSGPVSYGAEGIIKAHKAGAGAVVTKTIRDNAADNPFPHIWKTGKKTLINAEKWTDISAEQWIEKEIPEAKKHGVNVIASIGHKPEEVEHWVKGVEKAGADCIELVSYTEETILPMIEVAKKMTDLPVLAKLSPNWNDPVECAVKCVEKGVDGITAIDSVGPVLRIDIEEARPLLGGEKGMGWLTGEAIFPISLAIVAQIASRVDVPVIGLGGVMSAEEGIEMMMAGASAIGICSVLLVNGIEYIKNLSNGINAFLAKNDYNSISEIRGAALKNLPDNEIKEKIIFEYNPETCIECNKCVRLCPYQARKLKNLIMELDENQCRHCGLCASVCPVGALSIK